MASGITRSSLANKLDGYVEFTVGEIDAIATALGRTWLWVMTGDESPPPPVQRGEWGGDPNDGAPVQQTGNATNYPVGQWFTPDSLRQTG
jgi:hypothetical protein